MFFALADLVLHAQTACQVIDQGEISARVDSHAALVIAKPMEAITLTIPAFANQKQTANGLMVTRTVTVKNIGSASVSVRYEAGRIEGRAKIIVEPGEAKTFAARAQGVDLLCGQDNRVLMIEPVVEPLARSEADAASVLVECYDGSRA
jgi:hypothetical protein